MATIPLRPHPSVHTVHARKQGLTILPTEACNFACHYCHQPHINAHMGPDVVKAIICFVERKSKSIDRLDVSWFGGEPLANQKVVFELSRAFVRICRKNAIALHGFMSTNGYLLTRPLLLELVRLGIKSYQITFDGPQAVHDTFRLSKAGGATFSRIWGNVRSFQSVDEMFEILIRVHVMPHTVSDVASFLVELNEQFASDPRFKITVTKVSHWGGPHDAEIPVFYDAQPTVNLLRALIGQANEYPSANTYCNAADPTHLVIRPNGTIIKCAHSLELEENRIGYLTRTGHLVYEDGKIDFWIRGIINGDQDALQCPRNGIVKSAGTRQEPRIRSAAVAPLFCTTVGAPRGPAGV